MASDREPIEKLAGHSRNAAIRTVGASRVGRFSANALECEGLFFLESLAGTVLMAATLTKEQIEALHASPGDAIKVVDPETNRRYVVVDEDLHRQAMSALEAKRTHEAIARGLADLEAGRGKPLDQAFEDVRQRLGFSPRQ